MIRKMTCSYDSWLAKQVDDYYSQDSDGTGSLKFNMKLRGGTVKVECDTAWEADYDEDGRCGDYLDIKGLYVCWSFNPEQEVKLDTWELDEVKSMIKQIVGDI